MTSLNVIAPLDQRRGEFGCGLDVTTQKGSELHGVVDDLLMLLGRARDADRHEASAESVGGICRAQRGVVVPVAESRQYNRAVAQTHLNAREPPLKTEKQQLFKLRAKRP